MVSVPIDRSGYPTAYTHPVPAAGSASFPAPAPAAQAEWTNLVAAGTIVAGGALMVTGHKKAGLAVAAMGTVLALLDEPEAIETWWRNLPRYLDGAQELLGKVEHYLDEATAQGQRLKTILHR